MARLIDQAIVLREFEWSETSQVVVLLTEHHGKVRGLAKGSKRRSPSSLQRFSGGIELLTAGQIVANTKRTAELANLTEWDQQQSYPWLRTDLSAQWAAMYAAELTAAMLADLDAHPSVFQQLGVFLDALQRAKPQAALLRYQWALLDDCGYRPQLTRDVTGGGELARAQAYTFDPMAGGFTTQSGADEWRGRAAT
ncbi:MAG: DNA repair protein RecO, partial [Planctomycetes bacterium]|nr:DNA repair protein RecO [Planctomycetota bacterium]